MASSFAQTLTDASKKSTERAASGVCDLADAVVERFKAACLKAAKEQCQLSASCTFNEKLPDGVTVSALLNGNCFHKLLDAELKKLKLAKVDFKWECYDKAEVQEKVLNDDGSQQYKVKEVASYAASKKSKSLDDKFARHKFAPKWATPGIGKALPASGIYWLSTSSQKALDAPLAVYAQRETVLKKVAGPGAHVKVQITGRWP